MRIVPTAGPACADVYLHNPVALSAEEIAEIRSAVWSNGGVLRFPGLFLNLDELISFAEMFGPLDDAPTNANSDVDKYLQDHPKIAVISNIIEGGRAIGSLGAGEADWHTELSYREEPSKYCFLSAVEIPDGCPGTSYSNLLSAYAALPAGMKSRLDGLTCKHDATTNSVGELRHGFKENYDDRNDAPGAVHPLVCIHEESGCPSLYLGRRRKSFIPELSEADSTALLEELWTHATDERFLWHQSWRTGDLLMWDNRCTIHRRDAFDPHARRLLYRAQSSGTKPKPFRLVRQ